jgi:hypothetical protein
MERDGHASLSLLRDEESMTTDKESGKYTERSLQAEAKKGSPFQPNCDALLERVE